MDIAVLRPHFVREKDIYILMSLPGTRIISLAIKELEEDRVMESELWPLNKT